MVMPAINWTDIDPLLPDLIDAGKSQRALARQFGISQNSICRRIERIGLWPRYQKARLRYQYRKGGNSGRKRYNVSLDSLIKRQCLRCHRPFMAETRYLRLCPECRQGVTLWQGCLQ